MGLWQKRRLIMSFLFGSDETTLDTNKIKYYINEFKKSNKYKWMHLGQKYYDVDHDYLDIKTNYKDQNKADNRLIHATYKNIIDEKVAFSFSKDATIKGQDTEYIEKITTLLGKDFQNKLEMLAYEASNKGIAWLHPYVDEENNFKLMVIPSEQCIPIWEDATHEKLNSFIRIYPEKIWTFNEMKTFEHIEAWTSDGKITHYRMDNTNSEIMLLGDVNYPLRIDNQPYYWASGLPFIPFKNNYRELCDLKFIKSLIDNYDLTRSEAANYIQEVKNIIYVLKGYTGDKENLMKLRQMINQERIITLDADEGDYKSNVDALTPEMDITAIKDHSEQLKRDIQEYSQSVNKDIDKFGNAPSGVALKFLFSGLELKSDKFEQEFSKGFDKLLMFVNDFLNISIDPEVEIIFSHDMATNETEIIENCLKSKGLISDETIIANHPWVTNYQQEKEKLDVQNESEIDNIQQRITRKIDDEDGEA